LISIDVVAIPVAIIKLCAAQWMVVSREYVEYVSTI
jgi:hypothetical protein